MPSKETSLKEEVPDEVVAKEPPGQEPSMPSLPITDVVCKHGKLDPEKANDMKVITAVRCWGLRMPSAISAHPAARLLTIV